MALSLVVGGLVLGAAPIQAQVAPPAELVSDIAPAATRDARAFGVSADGRHVGYLLDDPGKPTRAFVRDRVSGETVIVPEPSGSEGVASAVMDRGGCHLAYWTQQRFVGSAGPDAFEYRVNVWDRCSGATSFELFEDSRIEGDPVPLIGISSGGGSIVFTSLGGRDWSVLRMSDPTGPEPPLIRLPLPGLGVDGLDVADDGSAVTLDVRIRPVILDPPVLVATAPLQVAPPPALVGEQQVVLWQPDLEDPVSIMSARPDGAPGVDNSFSSTISGDGLYVAFVTTSPDLVDVDLAGREQVVIRNVASATTALVTDTLGTPMPGMVLFPDLDVTGSHLAVSMEPLAGDVAPDRGAASFVTYAVSGPPGLPGASDVELVGYGVDGRAVTSLWPRISADGRTVAFTSDEGAVLTGDPAADDPRTDDAWVRDRRGRLRAEPSLLDFGTIEVGTSSGALRTTIVNESRFPVPLDGITELLGPFAVVADTCGGASLSIGGSCTVDVRFAPTAGGAVTGSVTVRGPGSEVEVGLRGDGSVTTTTSPPDTTAPPSTAPPTTAPPTTTSTTQPPVAGISVEPDPVAFGTTTVGTPLPPRTVTVRNIGETVLTPEGPSIGGSGADRFVVTIDECIDRVLAPGATCSIAVAALAGASGEHVATFTVAAGAVSDATTLTMSATFEPQLTMSPAVVRPGEVTAAIGEGFPAGVTVQLELDGIAWTTASVGADGTFRADTVLLAPFDAVGPRTVRVVDQPDVVGVDAPLLVNPATFRPGGFDGALAGGVRRLYAAG